MDNTEAYESLLGKLSQTFNGLLNNPNSYWVIILIGVLAYIGLNALIIIAAANYVAVKNSQAFDYDRLAKQIAKELRKGEKQDKSCFEN